MSTLADQIRELQARLEQINEEPAPPEQSAMNVASGNIPQASTNVAQATPDLPTNEIPTIDAPTFSQAYAQAKKQGLKKFKWCGIYAVKDKPRPKPPNPQPTGTIPYGNANVIDPEGKFNVPDTPAGRAQAGVASMI
jgi:hypothetical protein